MTLRLLSLALGYLFGLFQTGYLYGKRRGFDLTEQGSGNRGATNALRTHGIRAGLIVYAGDSLKAFVLVLLLRFLFRNREEVMLLALYGALGTALGNDFPFFLHFRGGKGVAASAGWVLALDWRMFLFCMAVFLVIVALTRIVSLGSLIATALLLPSALLLISAGHIALPESLRLEFMLLLFLICSLTFFSHRKNIGRLLRGQENRLCFPDILEKTKKKI